MRVILLFKRVGKKFESNLEESFGLNPITKKKLQGL